MSNVDPVSDLFTRIRNAVKAKQDSLVVPYSKLKLSILNVLIEEGFITKVDVNNITEAKKEISISLKYDDKGLPLIGTIRGVSKPSKRIYVEKSEIPKVANGFGISIVSTSKGVVSGKTARQQNVGGELIGIVY